MIKNSHTSGVAKRSIISLALASALGLASAGAAASSDSAINTLEALGDNWPDAQLQLRLDSEAADSSTVMVGNAISYKLSANGAGNCYLLHIDSHGQGTLMRPGNCNAGQDNQVAASFPESGKLSAGQPLGQETVYGIFSEQPLSHVDALLEGTPGFAPLKSEQALEDLVSDISASASSNRIAVASIAYQVDTEKVQYTTRGIIRNVSKAQEEPSDSEVLASFEVQSIQFDFGSDNLTEQGRLQVDAFGAALASPQLEGVHLKVAGHTDDQGEEAYNMDLSERRAKAVRRYIEDNYNVDGERITIEGHGESKPIADNAALQSRALNRRVEMVFTK